MGNTHSASYSNFKPRKNVHWKTAERPSAPGRPEIIPILSEEEPNAVTLKWAPPRHHGGAPLQGYQVECNRIGSPAWIRTSPPVVTKPELILTGLEPDFRYQFRVTAINAVGNSDCSELSDILNIAMDKIAQAAPKFLGTLEDVMCLENDKTELRVYFEGIPTPAISWFKDGFEVFSSRRTAITTGNDSSVLVFHQTLLNDEGEIKCTATNRAGHAVAKAKLILEASPKLRYPRQYEDGLLYEINETIFLKTSVVGKPAPDLEWRHNGQLIYSGDRIEISNSDKLSILRIHNAQRSDRGEYQIKATNSVGEDVASFLVTITAPPDPPSNIVVTRQIDKSVTLSWTPPLDDGGCKIGNYIVEYYRTGWNVWLKAITSRKLSATLFDLIEGSEYRFRVKAESPYGMSEPSQESSPVLIPGKSIDMTFLEVESRIINDAMVKEDGEEVVPQISPRRKRNSSYRRDDEEIQIPEKSYRSGQSPSHADRVEQVVRRRSLTEQMLSPKKKEQSPTGSNEFMLILCPNGGKTNAEKRRSFQLDLEDALSPPPISFSAPDLGSPFTPMRPIRNAVSSTELLHERAMDRFYRAVAMKEDMKSQEDQSSYIDKPEIQVEMHGDPYENAETDDENNENIAEELSVAMKSFASSKQNSNYLSSQNSQSYPSRWQSGSFDEDYTASTVSTGSDASENTSLNGEVGRMDYQNEEDQTYHPREMIVNSSIFDSQKQDQAVEILTKPAPLPDPNFVPKPILKRRDSNNILTAEQTQERSAKQKKSPEKSSLLEKLTKMPLQKSFPFPKIISKKQSSKLPTKDEKIQNEDNSKEPKVKSKEINKDSLDEGRIAIEYYGNIVKEYGRQKKPSNQYINTEQLKQAAEMQQVDTRQTKYFTRDDDPVTKEVNNINSIRSSLSLSAVKKNNIQRSLVKNDKLKNYAGETMLPPKIITDNANRKPARAVIVIPIDYEELENQAKINVRSAIDYTIDVCLLILAFWLFLFKDERLAIPVLVLIIYRQLQDAIAKNVPNWMKLWKVKKT